MGTRRSFPAIIVLFCGFMLISSNVYGLSPLMQSETGSISGRVYQSDGVSLVTEGVVRAMDYNSWQGGGTGDIDLNGSYTITNLPPGTYRVGAESNGFAKEFYNGASYFGSPFNATQVTVAGGQDVQNIDFTLDPGGTITGTVKNENGTAVLGGIPVDTAPYGGFGQCSDTNDGTFTLTGLPLNVPILVRAGGSGWSGCMGDNHMLEYWQDAAAQQNAAPITLTQANPSSQPITFTLSLGGSISGQFFQSDGVEPAFVNGQITLYDGATDDYLQSQSLNNAAGYQFGGLSPGSYVLLVRPQNYAYQYYADRLYMDVAARVTVTAGDSIAANFSLHPSGSISGNITDEQNAPLANVSVSIEGGQSGACTDANGNYQINGLPLDQSYIVGAHPNRAFCGPALSGLLYEMWSTSPLPAPDYDEGTLIPVTTGQPDVTGKDFVLVRANRITGTVKNSSSEPIQNARVSTYLIGNAHHRGGDGYTGPDGRYSLDNLPPGTYRVLVEAPGYVHTLYGGVALYGSPASAPTVTVGGGQTYSEVNFVLSPDGMIFGKIFNFNGSAGLGGIPVDTEPSSGRGICTNPDGSYFLNGLPLNTPIKVRAGGTSSRESCPNAPVTQYWQNQTDPANATPITLTAAQRARPDTDFALGLGGTVTGIARAASDNSLLNRVNIRVEFGGGVYFDACTDINGFYEFSNLPLNQPFKIRAGGNDNWCGGVSNYALEYWQEAADVNSATPITLTAAQPQPVESIDFTLDITGSDVCATVTEIPESECQALVAFYYSTGGPNWLVSTDWLTGDTPCTWYGVTCTGGSVTGLRLVNNRLTGRLPAALMNLPNLKRLDLHTDWWRLDAGANRLSGSIPPELGSLANLQTLYLDFNQITGSLPPEIGGLSSLQRLSISSNHLTGPLPPEIGGLTQLRGLALGGSLSGPLPQQLWTLTNLTTLGLRGRFDCPIPPEIGQLVNLRTLDLTSGGFSGPLPSQIGNLTALRALWLDKNRLSGEVPASITNLVSLSNLDLNYNALYSSDLLVTTFLNSKQPGWDTTQTAPPTGVTAGSSGVGSIQIAWTPIAYSSGEGYYEVSYSTQPNGQYTIAGNTPSKSTSSYMVDSLVAGQPYYFRLRTFSAAGPNNPTSLWSDFTAPVNAVPLSPPNAVPERNYFTNTTVTLTWSRISWASGYHLQVARDSAFTDIVLDKTDLTAVDLGFTLTVPQANRRYFWRVQAKKTDGTWGAWSPVESFIVILSS